MLRKIILLVFVFITLFSLYGSASAHGLLSTKSQEIEGYKVEHTVSADGSSILANYLVTHSFRLSTKDGDKDVPFESADIDFSKKDGNVVISANLQGSEEPYSVTQLDASMPTSGDYQVSITFNLPKGKAAEAKTVQANFDFTVEENPSTPKVSSTNTRNSDKNSSPGYILGGVALVVGILLGRFGPNYLDFLPTRKTRFYWVRARKLLPCQARSPM